MTKAVVVFSGGQDSTTCLFWAMREFGAENVHALSIRYGQRHGREVEQAEFIAEHIARVPHTVLDMPVLGHIGDSDLVRTDTEIKASGGRYDTEMPEGLPTSFVPGRNLLLLTVASAFAAKLGASEIVTGVCETDYSGYPDCRAKTIAALQSTLDEGLGALVQIHTPLMHLSKADTVRLARELSDGVDADLSCWNALAHSLTCYYGEHPGCGECPACKVRAAGFEDADEHDPAWVAFGEAQNIA